MHAIASYDAIPASLSDAQGSGGGQGGRVLAAGPRGAAAGPLGPAAGPANPGQAASSSLIHEHKAGSSEPADTYGDFGRRLGRWARACEEREELERWLEGVSEGDERRRRVLEKLEGCGSWVEFRHYFERGADEPVRLRQGQFCQLWKLCGVCAIRRSARLLRTYVPRIGELLDAGYQPHLFTGTVRNGDDLLERFRLVEQGIRSCWEGGRQERRGQGSHAWGDVLGCVFSFEFKRGKRSGQWHPHVHGVIFLRRVRWSGPDLIEAYVHAVGDGEAHVAAQDVRPLRAALSAIEGDKREGETIADQLASDAVEVFKYPLKFGDLCPSDRWDVAELLHGRRLIRSYGVIRGLQVSEEPLDSGDEPYIRFVLGYERRAREFLARRISICN